MFVIVCDFIFLFVRAISGRLKIPVLSVDRNRCFCRVNVLGISGTSGENDKNSFVSATWLRRFVRRFLGRGNGTTRREKKNQIKSRVECATYSRHGHVTANPSGFDGVSSVKNTYVSFFWHRPFAPAARVTKSHYLLSTVSHLTE